MNPTLIVHHAEQLVTVDPTHTSEENPLGIIENGAMILEGDRIVWLGRSDEIRMADHPEAEWVDARGRIVLPGLIDSHTHPVFAGERAKEFELRLKGATYLEIAQQGGGIRKSVESTRQASEEELYHLARKRLMTMLSFGVTTVEAKSGYGLDLESELKSLRVIQRLRKELPLHLHPTFLGAHDIPPEYQGKTDAYVEQLCTEQIPAVAREGLAEFCDVFCEEGYFSVAQSRRILETARQHGLKLRIHAEEFCDLGGAALGAELGALSADHLLHISDEGIEALRQSGTVATLLPGTAFYLRLKDYAPARKLLDAGVSVALATDFNPGSCMSENLQLVMTLGCLQMGMLPVEVIRAVTLNAAKALACDSDRGSLSVGKRADFVLFNASHYTELLYHFGVNHVHEVFTNGSLAWRNVQEAH